MKYSNQIVRINNTTCKQVSKQTARKLFAEGKEIYLHPCNMALNNMWMSPCNINIKECMYFEKNASTQFDNLVTNYEYYNCVNELGKYANFFTPIN